MDIVINGLSYIVFFVILIAVLVFVHELGHFLFAKLFKVKVHTFALGMGPRVLGFRKGETDYRLSAFPIGGYVKMLGEDPSEVLEPEDKGRAFGDKPVWQRLIIVAGGPAFSLAFPLFLYFGMRLASFQVVPAEFGIIYEDMPAWAAGMRPGDRVVAVDGEAIHSFEQFSWAVEDRPSQKLTLAVLRGGKTLNLSVTPAALTEKDPLGNPRIVGKIGVAATYERSFIGVRDSSAAQLAGLASFDLITAVNGEKVSRLLDLEVRLVRSAGGTATLTIQRLKPDAQVPFPRGATLDSQLAPETHTVTLSVPAGTTGLDELGIERSAEYVYSVTPNGAAAAIGIEKGDRLLSLDGKESVHGSIHFAIEQTPDKPHTIAWLHGQQRREATYQPQFVPAGEAGKLGTKRDTYDKGMWSLMFGEPLIEDNPAAVVLAWKGTARDMKENLGMMLDGIGALVTGKVNLQALGGFIMIGQLAGDAAKEGAGYFLWMMALISLNLGLINLFPIPVLDGGQIVMISIEGVLRKPLSLKLKERIMIVGVAMLVVLMVFATRNDIMRLIVN